MCAVVDSGHSNGYLLGKKLYSGQNRSGVDQFISEVSNDFGRRWCVLGQSESDVCEGGFMCGPELEYRDFRLTFWESN